MHCSLFTGIRVYCVPLWPVASFNIFENCPTARIFMAMRSTMQTNASVCLGSGQVHAMYCVNQRQVRILRRDFAWLLNRFLAITSRCKYKIKREKNHMSANKCQRFNARQVDTAAAATVAVCSDCAVHTHSSRHFCSFTLSLRCAIVRPAQIRHERKGEKEA